MGGVGFKGAYGDSGEEGFEGDLSMAIGLPIGDLITVGDSAGEGTKSIAKGSPIGDLITVRV